MHYSEHYSVDGTLTVDLLPYQAMALQAATSDRLLGQINGLTICNKIKKALIYMQTHHQTQFSDAILFC